MRLNKALRELNIGLQTAVDFLKKRSELGEVKDEPSFKLNDAQYKALVEAFKQDAAVRTEAEKLFKKPKEKRQRQQQAPAVDPKSTTKAEDLLPSSRRQQYTVKGKIDLDNLGRKPAAPAAQPQEKAAAVSPQKEPKAAPAEPAKKQETPKNAHPTAPQPQKKAENGKSEKSDATANNNNKKQQQPVAPKAEVPVQTEKKEKDKEEKEDDGVFHLKSETKILNAPKVNVLGKIDLSAINQSTRPKKKSKDEKRKEREEKAAQNGGGERRKRQRINNKERVDINAAANQNSGRGGGQNGNGNGKKKKRNRGNQKPVEVSEEDVAKQVKETLARLTSKTQTKKGAKYRKEKREAVQEKLSKEANAEKKESKTLKLTEFVTVSELATMMGKSVNEVIGTLMSIGVMASINQHPASRCRDDQPRGR